MLIVLVSVLLVLAASVLVCCALDARRASGKGVL